MVVIPPLHHQITTARLTVGRGKADLLDAKRALEQALSRIDARSRRRRRDSASRSAGACRTFATASLGSPTDGRFRSPPRRRPRVTAARTSVPVLLDSLRFPSDPHDVALEQNDVCLLFAATRSSTSRPPAPRLFKELDGLLEITSIRKGFVGGGGSSAPSLPKQMAVRAGFPAPRGCPTTPALPRVHLDAEEGARPRPDREHGDPARVDRPMAGRLLPARHDDARLPSARGPRDVVRDLSYITGASGRGSGPASTSPTAPSPSPRAARRSNAARTSPTTPATRADRPQRRAPAASRLAQDVVDNHRIRNPGHRR